VRWEIEEAKKMQYITSIERRGIKQGLQQGLIDGIILGLEIKFGKEGKRELHHIKRIQNLELLRSIFDAIKTALTLEELRQIYINQVDEK
jgi:hypothetical protein